MADVITITPDVPASTAWSPKELLDALNEGYTDKYRSLNNEIAALQLANLLMEDLKKCRAEMLDAVMLGTAAKMDRLNGIRVATDPNRKVI